MKRIAAVLLTLITVLSLTACSLINRNPLEGTWEWTVDYVKVLQAIIPEKLAPEFPPEARLELTVLLNLNEDGTYLFSLDQEGLCDEVLAFSEAMIPWAVEYEYRKMELFGMSREKYDKLLAASGTTVEKNVRKQYEEEAEQWRSGSADTLAYLQQLGFRYFSGSYHTADGVLYLSRDDSVELGEGIEYTLRGRSMQWGEAVSPEDSEENQQIQLLEESGLLPMVWVKRWKLPVELGG